VLLAIDLGNTKLTLGIFNGRRLVRSYSTTPASAGNLRSIIAAWVGPYDAKQIEGVSVSSVRPSADQRLRRGLRRLYGVTPLFVSGRNAGMRVKGYDEGQLGSDRLVGAMAAFERYKRPCVVVDAGTAITIDLVNARGEFEGGVIVPGLNIAADSLHQAAEKLPLVRIAPVRAVRGRDTRSAIRSGIVHGFAAMVDGLVRAMTREARTRAVVVATGGHASLLRRMCATVDHVNRHLVLEGLRIVWERHGLKA